MVVTPVKAFFFAVGASAVVAGAAYVSGALDPYLSKPPATASASLEDGAQKSAQASAQPAGEQPAPAPEASAEARPSPAPAESQKAEPQKNATAAAQPDEATKPAETAAPAVNEPPAPQNPAKPKVIAPTFDVVRVEGDGSIVVAGQAAPNAKVAVIHGSAVLGETTADGTGAFAIALDHALKPGDYQIVLRSTAPGGVVATSTQTAVVSVPEKSDGQVLALVEEPGKPSELITVPKPPKTSETLPSAEKPATASSSAASEAPASAVTEPAAPAASGPKIAVEAVEIDGGKVFVAGIADPGRKVRVYANDILLGQTITSPDGHFLVEATRDLPVGDYIIHADALADDGSKVLARAAVPFQREAGETMSAVAPSADEATSPVNAKPEAATSSGEAKTPDTPPTDTAAPAKAEQSADIPETVSPKLEHADGAVIIRRGDTLWQISRRVYGHGVRYSTIYLANQDQITDPDMIWPGQVFKVPENSNEGEPANLKAMGAQVTQLPDTKAGKKP
ncbi:LysM peptidoglycan-binding domain-containing protein [Manganibacter manganicus]|uniref:Peptigoglycan-binding protein LysM n=1 Tax=Manganibacter manganicus TaxID=1873176 RepID=A0A1V8RKP3_9HYPH|nr:LysM peptidoglycan-binding domain-containing protein [Pseudaminobacter manganicus]OQM73519.1 peptigoglycan-binding protein LysM [Pseudaminobacter manganicus]